MGDRKPPTINGLEHDCPRCGFLVEADWCVAEDHWPTGVPIYFHPGCYEWWGTHGEALN